MAEVNGIIYDRLKLFNGYMRDLLEYQNVDLNTFLENTIIRRAVERTLHIAIESCIDIGQRLVAAEGFKTPDSNRGVFEVLNEEDVLPGELLPNMQAMASFHNLLVHGYARIEDEKVFDILKNHLGDFDDFAKAIVAYLETGP